MFKVQIQTLSDICTSKADFTINYRFSETPFGTCFLAESDFGVCALEFSSDIEISLADLKKTWKNALIKESDSWIQNRINTLFDLNNSEEISVLVQGTPFQIKVWQALLQIPFGKYSTYSTIAQNIGQPTASRAVGNAVGQNPVSFLIPCHRVLRTDGKIGGFRWGISVKTAILEWEKIFLTTQ